jgi:fructose-1-phosphate kinase PfkB-like protein
MVDSPYPELERQPRLVLRFALYAGAVLLAAGLAIAWLVNREVANRAERTVEQQAAAVVTGNLSARLRAADFRGPVAPARRAELDTLCDASSTAASASASRGRTRGAARRT